MGAVNKQSITKTIFPRVVPIARTHKYKQVLTKFTIFLNS